MSQLIDRIESGSGSFQFEACFDLTLPEVELRHQVVVTLLAILEMARLKVVRVLQSPDGETLFISQAAGVTIEAARRAAMTAGEAREIPVQETVERETVEQEEGEREKGEEEEKNEQT